MRQEHRRPTDFTVNIPLCSLSAEADKYEDSFGITDRYSTGNDILDEWLGGGFGKRGSYELITVFGDTGVGKSTVSMQLLKDSVVKGVPQAWMILEDSLLDTNMRFRKMFPTMEEANKAISQEVELESGMTIQSPILMSREVVNDKYNLDDLYDWIEERIKIGIHLFLLDHLQFAFDNSEEISDTKMNEKQRRFLKRIEDLMVATNSTIIMVSHTNKDKGLTGMDKIYGASAIKQSSTKIIEVASVSSGKGEDLVLNTEYLKLFLHKNRHVRRRPEDGHWIYIHRSATGFGFDAATTVMTTSMGGDYAVNA